MKEKKEQKIMARRCFLTDCAKFAIGAPLLYNGIEALGNTNDTYRDYSYCIYRCPSPCSYDSGCVGCRDDNNGARATCTVRNCVIDKNLLSCAHCSELSICDKDLWINYPGQRQFALNKQNEWSLLTGIANDRTKQNVFNVFPNITTDGFTIHSTNHLGIGYKVFDINGQIVKSGKLNSNEQYVDISSLSSGSYILNIIKDNELLYLNKIIKE